MRNYYVEIGHLMQHIEMILCSKAFAYKQSDYGKNIDGASSLHIIIYERLRKSLAHMIDVCRWIDAIINNSL